MYIKKYDDAHRAHCSLVFIHSAIINKYLCCGIVSHILDFITQEKSSPGNEKLGVSWNLEILTQK